MENANQIPPTTVGMINALRCWRCGEIPKAVHLHGSTGLTCFCRHYVLPVEAWVAQAACKDQTPQAIPISDRSFFVDDMPR